MARKVDAPRWNRDDMNKPTCSAGAPIHAVVNPKIADGGRKIKEEKAHAHSRRQSKPEPPQKALGMRQHKRR